VPGIAVGAVGVPVNSGLVDNTTDPVPVEVLVPVPPLAILNGVVKLNVPDDIAVAVTTPAAKPPAPSLLTIVFAVFDDVAAFNVDAILVILAVFASTLVFNVVMLAVALFILESKVVIVDEFTPPTLFTVGASAVPVKSPASFNIPLNSVVASGAIEFVIILAATNSVVAS
jgi:hypothetical protein